MSESDKKIENIQMVDAVTISRANVFTEAKERFLLEGQKGLLLINGGGAVALAAFLQATWEKVPFLREYVLLGILANSIGLVVASLIPYFRHIAFIRGHNKRNQFWYLVCHRITPFMSVAFFALGMALVVYGGFEAIHRVP